MLALDPIQPAGAPVAAPDTPGVAVHLATLGSISVATPWLAGADVLIAEVDVANPVQIDEFARLVRVLPIPVVAAARALTVDATRRLMRAGAVDVLPLPLGADDLVHAVDAAGRDRRTRTVAASPSTGRIVCFVGAIGGVGTTALAVQAGCLWAADASVCLVDFDIQFGSAALYLNMKPQLNLVDLVEAGERLDAEILQTVAARHASGLGIVATPGEMMPLETLNPALALRILSIAQQNYDVVLVDLPAAWTDWSLAVLERADLTVMVTSMTVPGIHHARRKLDLMDTNQLTSLVVLNRVAHQLFRSIDLGDVEKVLRRKVDFTVANDFPTVSGAVDQGRTLNQVKPKSRVERDLTALVTALTAKLAQDAEA